MRTSHSLRQAVVLAAVSIGTFIGAGAVAQAMPPDFVLACDNGHSYPIHARAVTVDGDMVTGYISTGRGRHIHIRLVPMGVGYRYIAPGLWADGVGTEAALNFGSRHSVACTVSH